VIHGDLKPENILITEDGEVKVIDFGIARLHEEPKKTAQKPSKIIGTPNYMSPERKEDPSKISFASDIYALGVIAYELAMGKLSFGVIHLSLLPRGLKKIIEKALAVSLSERYPDSISFITDLSQYLKSGGLERDRPGSDQLKEVLETLQLANASLSPSTLPKWPQLDMGIAKYKGPGPVGSYYDFLKLPDNSYALLLSENPESKVDSGTHLGLLRGFVHAAFSFSPPTSSQLAPFVKTLNRLIKENAPQQTFSFSLLLLNPIKEELSFISCGLGGLIHVPTGRQHPRKMSNNNPLLGESLHTDFFVTTDNWEIGDTLIFHSLDASLENLLFEAITENLLLSAQGQAEALLKKATSHPTFSQQKNPKVLLSLQRVG
jgi:serine/threonine protein kinase